MEENEVILLKKSKINVAAVGKWTNIFSIFAAIGLLLMVALGVAMLYFSGKLDYSTPYYLDNILGLGGVVVIVLAAALLPAVLYMRRVVHAAKQMEVNNDLFPIVDFMRQQRSLWHYMGMLIVVLFIVGIVAALVGGFILFSMFNRV